MAHRLKTPRGRKLYAQRKQTPEPVFGIIKSVMGYRQCLLRGLENVRGEWNLVTLSWNIKRMHRDADLLTEHRGHPPQHYRSTST